MIFAAPTLIAPTNPVTLNSFQGPSPGLRRSVVTGRGGSAGLSRQGAALAARWMLKQVQHDDVVRGAQQ
jgi:hypothetical protein